MKMYRYRLHEISPTTGKITIATAMTESGCKKLIKQAEKMKLQNYAYNYQVYDNHTSSVVFNIE